jgi:hypothetical protein
MKSHFSAFPPKRWGSAVVRQEIRQALRLSAASNKRLKPVIVNPSRKKKSVKKKREVPSPQQPFYWDTAA